MNLNPSFNAWELATGAAVGAAIIAGTGWAAVPVLIGSALVAVVFALREKQWPAAVAVLLGLWAFHGLVKPILPDWGTLSGALTGVEAVTEDVGRTQD